MVPLALGLRESRRPAATPRRGARQGTGAALREASRTPGFWLLTIGFFVCGFHVTFIGLHLPPYIADKAVGMNFLGTRISPLELGGWAIGLVGLFNIAGALIWGWLGGRYPKKDMLALLYALRAAAFIVFLSIAAVLGVGAAVRGLARVSVARHGAADIGLVGYMFGPTHMSMLWGIVFFSHQLGSFFGGWGAGRLYDVRGNYDAMWWISVGLGVLAALLHWQIRERPAPRLAMAQARHDRTRRARAGSLGNSRGAGRLPVRSAAVSRLLWSPASRQSCLPLPPSCCGPGTAPASFSI